MYRGLNFKKKINVGVILLVPKVIINILYCTFKSGGRK